MPRAVSTSPSAVLLLALLLLASPVQAQRNPPAEDPELQRLRQQLAQLEDDPRFSQHAPLEFAAAREALRRLAEPRLNAEQRAHRLYLAERRIEILRASVSRDAAIETTRELERERDRLLLLAARHEAEVARREANRLRMLSLAQAEDAARARAEAEAADQDRAEAERLAEQARREAEQTRRLAEAQAREAELARREAELAAAAAESLRRQLQSLTAEQGSQGMMLTLGDVVFATGESRLKPEALANLDRVIEFIEQYPDRRIRIEGHTDSRGSRNLNQVLSQQRADAVRDALIARGIRADRIEAVGMGPDFPVASNDTEEGRARNRRVDIIALDPR